MLLIDAKRTIDLPNTGTLDRSYLDQWSIMVVRWSVVAVAQLFLLLNLFFIRECSTFRFFLGPKTMTLLLIHGGGFLLLL